MDELRLGPPVKWRPAARPRASVLKGSHVVLRPVDPAGDAEPLYAASHPPSGDPAIWTYLPDGPYENPEQLRQMLSWAERSEDPLYFTLVRRQDERPLGIAAYLRITPEFGTIETGHIWFAPQLQRTAAATEAIYLLAAHIFDELGYRRLEWKCNALNSASRRAAERFGFRFEAIFRNHQVVKGRNRDTAWYAITVEEWPAVRAGFQAWLSTENFDHDGRQKRRLGELIDEQREQRLAASQHPARSLRLGHYTAPQFASSALVTIDVQRDVLDGGPLEIPGTSEILPNLRALTQAFRTAGRPIVQVVRLYEEGGGNADLCRREAVENGARILCPGSEGAELAPELLPDPRARLETRRLLAGEPQEIGRDEYVLYKPRWGAFFRTALEQHLREREVTTLVLAGCNFPNCPRTTIYEANERDFRVAVACDTVSGLYRRGEDELRAIGISLMHTREIVAELFRCVSQPETGDRVPGDRAREQA